MELPQADSWLVYRLTDDVGVCVKSDTDPQRRRQVRDAMAQFAELVRPSELPSHREAGPKSDVFKPLVDDLGIEYFEKGNGTIDNNKALRYRGKMVRAYFNEATSRREAYFALARTYYEGFDWAHWRDADVTRNEPTHFQKIPNEGEEREAWKALLGFLSEHHL